MSRTPCTLITGASSGIGRETAVRMSRTCSLILHGRDSARLEETRRLCSAASSHVPWIMDLRAATDIEPSLKELLDSRGLVVRNFIHCAGTLKIQALRLVNHGDASDLMNVNFVSAVEIARLLVKKKVNEGQLRGIVFVSSTASRFGARGFTLYCASKGALDAFMRGLAVELAPGTRVNSVLPGAVRTAMTETMLDDQPLRERIESSYPLGAGVPSDIASVIEFLLSDAARWITGQQLVVDGGRTINITA